MGKKIKICHIIGDFVNGGVESIIYNYFSHMDLSKFEVHMIGHGIRVQECADRFQSLGFNIHNITPKSVSFSQNLKEMESIFRKYRFDIVHSHLTEWACVPMYLAWKCGIKVRINHSHMAERPTGLKNRLYYGIRIFLGKMFATDYYACGRDAGIYLFGHRAVDSGKVMILPNAIDFDSFQFDPQIRKRVREQNGIDESTVVIGHVGRFFEQKNHRFLIDIFDKYHKLNPSSLLLLIGDGELFDEIEKKVEEKSLSSSVWFLRVRSDVADWYQAMDLFLLPSLFEGFPVVGVEAQAAGLPCLFSDSITPEISISSCANFASLKNDADTWAKKMKKMVGTGKREHAILDYERFDIKKNAEKLELFYETRIIQQ